MSTRSGDDAFATDPQVEDRSPHLSNDLKSSSPEEYTSSPNRLVSIQEHDSHAIPADGAKTRPHKDRMNNFDRDAPAIEESNEARLERLGSQRPEVFGSIWAEIGFVFSISMSQVLTV